MVKSHQNRASFRAIGNVLRPIRGWISNGNNGSDNNNGRLVDHHSRIVHDNNLLGNGTSIQQNGRMTPASLSSQHQQVMNNNKANEYTEDADEDLNFRRSIKARMSLPIVKSTNSKIHTSLMTATSNNHHQEHQDSLGFVYLQFRTETKRASLPNEITTIDTVHALFVRSFPHQLTMNFFSSPDIKVYIHEATRNVFYELQDVQDIRNQSLLRIYQRDPRNSVMYQPLVNVPATVAIQKQQQQQQQQQQQMISNMTNAHDIYQQRAIATPGSREPLYGTNDSLLAQNHYGSLQQEQLHHQYSGKAPIPLPPMQQHPGASTPLHQYYGTTQSLLQNNGYQPQHLTMSQQQSMQVNASRMNGSTYPMNDATGRPMSATTLPPNTHLMPIYGTHQANSLNTVTVPPPKPQRMMHYKNGNRLGDSQNSIISRNSSLPMPVAQLQQQQQQQPGHANGNGSMSNGSNNHHHHHQRPSLNGNHISFRPLPERPYSVTGTDEQSSFQSIDRATDFTSLSQNSHHIPRHDTTPSSLSNCNQSIYCSSASNVTNSTTSDSTNGNTNSSSGINNDNNNRIARTTSKKVRPEPVVDEEARQRVMQLEQKLDSLSDLVQSILSLHRSRSLSVQP